MSIDRTNRRWVVVVGLLAFVMPVNAATNQVETGTTKPCFQCQSSGSVKCPAPGCKDGQVPCPAPCIKLDQGIWVKRPGRPDPTEVMQPLKFGKKIWYVSSHHPGVQYTLKPDGTLDMQTCPVCHGATRVQCKVCRGTGTVVCQICDGKKVVPLSWSAFDNPKMKDRPTRFKLRDGTTLVGWKKMISGDQTTIRAESGDVRVKTQDIVSEEKRLRPGIPH